MENFFYVVRDLINRSIENNEELKLQTRLLSNRRMTIVVPDLLPLPLSLNTFFGSDGLLDKISIKEPDSELSPSEDLIRIIITKVFIVAQLNKLKESVSSGEKQPNTPKFFGQGLRIEGDADDIQVVSDIVSLVIAEALKTFYSTVDKLKKLKNFFSQQANDFYRGKSDVEEYLVIVKNLMERVENLEKKT
tara:strand:- start:623 stop:1195 length:573 start_codon:yes stop_codon:yes gene_type:complete